VNCTITQESAIFLSNLLKTDTLKERQETYGHEQRHILAENNARTELAAENEAESEKCTHIDDAMERLDKIFKELTEKSGKIGQAGAGHDLGDHGGPADTVGYLPIGQIPDNVNNPPK